MAVDFIFFPPSFSIPTLQTLRDFWVNVPDRKIIDFIAAENQYLCFHDFLLKNLKFTKIGHANNPPYIGHLMLSARAGAIKAAILICASIAEAVLRSHAEKRKYSLAKNHKKRTFGNVLNAWKKRGQPHPDVKPIWGKLEELRNTRNNIHLYAAATNPQGKFQDVLLAEQSSLTNAYEVIKFLQKLKT